MVRGEWSLPRISYLIKDPKIGLFTHTFSTDVSIIPMAIKNNILFSNPSITSSIDRGIRLLAVKDASTDRAANYMPQWVALFHAD